MTCRFLASCQQLTWQSTRDRNLPPEIDELVAQDTAVPAAIAIVVAHALPRNDGRQTLGLASSYTPLGSSIVADTEQTDLAGRPWLLSSPLDYVEKAFACATRHGVEEAWGLSKTTLVSADHDVIVLRPETGIWCLPC